MSRAIPGKMGLVTLTMALALVVASGVALAVTKVGTNGDDTLSGASGDDSLYGLGGKDVLRGGRGNDLVEGGAGSDQVRGGPDGNETYGGPGPDTITSSGSGDEIYGGSGNDTINADNDVFDYVDCGRYSSPSSPAPDNDTADVDEETDVVVECENVI